MQKFVRAARRYGLPVAVAGLAGNAVAQTAPTIDVSTATSFISGSVTTAIGAVGLALIILAALVLGYRWVKASFF